MRRLPHRETHANSHVFVVTIYLLVLGNPMEVPTVIAL